jgi:YggT family protein
MTPWITFITFIASTIQNLLGIYIWIVIIAAVLTWIEPNPYNPIVRFLYGVTEPLFDWVREHVPVFFGGIDFSPLVVIIGIQFINVVLIPTLLYYLIPHPV